MPPLGTKAVNCIQNRYSGHQLGDVQWSYKSVRVRNGCVSNINFNGTNRAEMIYNIYYINK